MATKARFDPEHLSFDEGLERLQRIVSKSGLNTRKVITSRDKEVRSVVRHLGISAVPGGFTKWQLPIYLNNPAQLYISVGAPNAEVGEHSHDNGDGIRFIISGSIEYRGIELTAGDWMFIPAGERYSFVVGPFGASMCYCYCCSCAGAADLLDQVVDPPINPGV